MTRTLRIVLAAVLLVSLLAGGASTVAADAGQKTNDADGSEILVSESGTTVINDNDLADVDDSLNDIAVNVLGVQNDGPLGLL